MACHTDLISADPHVSYRFGAIASLFACSLPDRWATLMVLPIVLVVLFGDKSPFFFGILFFSLSSRLLFLKITISAISSCLQDVLQMLRNHRRAGTYSKEFVDDVGTTWICVQCPLGSAQPYGASLACEPCSFGTYQDELGHLSNNCWYLSSRQLCDFSIF